MEYEWKLLFLSCLWPRGGDPFDSGAQPLIVVILVMYSSSSPACKSLIGSDQQLYLCQEDILKDYPGLSSFYSRFASEAATQSILKDGGGLLEMNISQLAPT